MQHLPSNRSSQWVLSLGALCAGLAGCAGTSTSSDSAEHAPVPVEAHAQAAGKVTPAGANKQLVEGNARFVSGYTLHPHQDPERRTELATSQHPFAVILAC